MSDKVTQFWEIDEQVIRDNTNKFTRFFESSFDDLNYYREAVEDAFDNDKHRLIVNLDHLRNFDSELCKNLIMNPREYYHALELALQDYVRTVRTSPPYELFVGLKGGVDNNKVSPRGLSSRHLNQIVCIDGIVTKASLVNPKLVTAIQFDEVEMTIQRPRTFRDSTDGFGELPSTSALSTKNENGHPLKMIYGDCEYIDHQILTVQERPENAPPGQMPRSCDIIVDRDLADSCKPGDRVNVYGIYRVLVHRSTGVASGVYRPKVVASSVELSTQAVAFEISPTDKVHITEISKREDIIELLSRSIAPSIYGHDAIKKALVLLLAGGVETNLMSGTHIRGDINILMVGDPSTAKSQLLRHILAVAPLAVHTTGRGSSGVGLTAAVVSDSETGERKLEAGAMVLGDRGVVCIDEFDKMDETDRVAIHEALEQQTVTISKAGIHASLNARCSVAAAANPVWSTYNAAKSPMENIGLPDSLLSRFDLLFIVLDKHNRDIDAMIADHVLRSHRWRGKIESDPHGVFIQPDPLLHGDSDQDFLSLEFLKKYLFHAKSTAPQLSDQGNEVLCRAWTDLRTRDTSSRKTQPITPRAFETLIRLATAHAKLRLASTVTIEDAEAAVDILRQAIFGTYDEDEQAERKKRKKKGSTKKGKKSQNEPIDETETIEPQQPEDEEEPDSDAPLTDDIKDVLRQVYVQFLKKNADNFLITDFVDYARQKGSKSITPKQVNDFLNELQASEQLIIDDGMGYPAGA